MPVTFSFSARELHIYRKAAALGRLHFGFLPNCNHTWAAACVKTVYAYTYKAHTAVCRMLNVYTSRLFGDLRHLSHFHLSVEYNIQKRVRIFFTL